MAIPNFIVLLIPAGVSKSYLCCQADGYLGYGDESVFSPLVKIAVEKSTVNNNYVHLRFTYNNKYWQKSKDNNNLVAVSNQPVEDTTDPFCTLFEPSVASLLSQQFVPQTKM